MSGMSRILWIALYRDVPSPQRAGMNEGNGRSGRYYPKAVPLSFSSLRDESWAVWMDAQYAAHAAHAYDPSVLDAGHAHWNRPRQSALYPDDRNPSPYGSG